MITTLWALEATGRWFKFTLEATFETLIDWCVGA